MTNESDTATSAAKLIRARRANTRASVSARPATPASAATSKSDTVIKLLLRAKGASPLELIAATDWQAHSVRAFLSGLRKKGRVLAREARKSGEFAYRIVVPSAPAAALPAEGARGSTTDDVTSTDTAQA